MRRGRLLDERDISGAPLAVVISESLARRRFPGHDPIGQRLHVGATDRPWYTVVGIVGDVQPDSLAVSETDAVYVTNEQWSVRRPRALARAPRARERRPHWYRPCDTPIWCVDKDQPSFGSRPWIASSLIGSRAAFALILFEAFGIVALVLAATGIYGLLSGSVTERTREIGVRSALGASRRDILDAGGSAGHGPDRSRRRDRPGGRGGGDERDGLAVLRYLAARPATYAGGSAVLIAVAALACGVPARRAASIDPAVTLRTE